MIPTIAPPPIIHPFDLLGRVAKALWVAFVTVAVGVLLAYISSSLPVQEIAKRMMTRIYAPFLTLNYSTQGRDTITVMTVDDVDLQSYGLSWPIPLDFYQRLIDRLVSFRPRAVFLDVLFLDDRDVRQVEKLRQSTCKASDAGVPVFIATMARPDGALTGGNASVIPPSNVEASLFNAKNSIGKPCVVPTLANITPDKLDQSQWQYPLTRNIESGRSSVALSMFCQFNTDQCPRDIDEPMALIWGTRASLTNEQTMMSRDAAGRVAPICRSQWHPAETIPGVSVWQAVTGHSPALPLCPYHQVIPIRAFQYLDRPVAGYGFSSSEMSASISGKIVLVGADLAASGDNVISPFHGRLPGVHVHAMALDNLIETRGLYIQDGEFGGHRGWNTRTNWFTVLAVIFTAFTLCGWSLVRPRPSGVNDNGNRNKHELKKSTKPPFLLRVLVVVILFIPTFVAALLGYPKAKKEKLSTTVKWAIGGALVYGLLSVLLLWLGYVIFRQGPLVIIKYVMFPLLAHFTHLGELFTKRIYLWWISLAQPSPWQYMSKVNSAAGTSHPD